MQLGRAHPPRPVKTQPPWEEASATALNSPWLQDFLELGSSGSGDPRPAQAPRGPEREVALLTLRPPACRLSHHCSSTSSSPHTLTSAFSQLFPSCRNGHSRVQVRKLRLREAQRGMPRVRAEGCTQTGSKTMSPWASLGLGST